MVGVAAEDVFLTGGESFVFFETEHDGDVLVAVEAVGDEEGDDDDIGCVWARSAQSEMRGGSSM